MARQARFSGTPLVIGRERLEPARRVADQALIAPSFERMRNRRRGSGGRLAWLSVGIGGSRRMALRTQRTLEIGVILRERAHRGLEAVAQHTIGALTDRMWHRTGLTSPRRRGRLHQLAHGRRV